VSYEQKPTTAQIEAARGHFFVPGYPYKVEKRPLCALSNAEQESVAQRRAAVHKHLPEVVPFIKELHAGGLFAGWRGVGEVELIGPSTGSGRTDFIEGNEHGTA
jgi:hypothetical protein